MAPEEVFETCATPAPPLNSEGSPPPPVLLLLPPVFGFEVEPEAAGAFDAVEDEVGPELEGPDDDWAVEEKADEEGPEDDWPADCRPVDEVAFEADEVLDEGSEEMDG